MAAEPVEGNPDPYEQPFSYKVHYEREVENPDGGSSVFGEEARLSAATLNEAVDELEAFKAAKADDLSLSNFRLLEIRWLKKSA